MKRKQRILIITAVVSIFLIQSLYLFTQTALGDTADEDDLSFEISGTMDIDTVDMIDGNEMGLGMYQVGATKTWYQEPFISEGTFDLDRLDMDFANINRPFYNSTSYQNISIDDSMGNSSIYNTTEVPEYHVGSGAISQLKFQSNYNYSYSENNVSSYTSNYGTNTGTVEDLNKTDDLSFNISSQYDFAQQYYLDNDPANPHFDHSGGLGTVEAGHNDILETKVDDPSELDSYIQFEPQLIGSATNLHGVYHGYEAKSPVHAYNHENDPNVDVSDEDYEEHKIYSPAYATKLKVRTKYIIPIPDHNYDNLAYMRVRVKVKFTHDLLVHYDPAFITEHKLYFQMRDYISNEWDTFDWTYGQDISWSGSAIEFDETLSGSDMYRYSHADNIYISLYSDYRNPRSRAFVAQPQIKNLIEVDYVGVYTKYKQKLDVKLETPNFEGGRVYLKMRSVDGNVQLIDNNGITIYSGNKYYDGDYNLPTLGTARSFDVSDLNYFRIYYRGANTIQVELWYCIIYNLQEKHRVDYDFSFDFEGQESIDNVYNASIRYNASTSGVFNIEYGDAVNGYIQLGSLDSTSLTTENFSFSYFSNDYEPNLKITLLEFTDTNPDINSYNITIEEINMTSNYQPFAAIHLVNFTYKVLGIEYNDNITCSFGDNYNYTIDSGTVDFFINTGDLDQYDTINTMTIVEQNISLMFEIPFNITFTNISFRVDYSGIQWCSSTEYNLQLNGDDILPLGPKSGYLDILSSFPSSLSFTADQDLRFQMETETSFTFAKELEIISRRVLRSSFTLESDRAIFIGHITFAEDIVPQSVWLNSIQYSFSGTNHSINPDITMNIGETFILEVYLAEDIYKQLEYYYNSLGSGAFDFYLSGTTSDPFFDDKTKDYNFFIQLPSDFYLAWMDLQFSDLNYLPDYTSNGSHDISDYGFYGPDISNEDVSWSQYWYQQNGLAYKMDEHGGSGYEDVYSEGFDSLTGEMTLDSYPSYYNNTYDFGDNLTMVNEFPNEYHEEDWYNWSINSNSTFSTTKYNVSGYYPATNNFMNDIIGETGTDIGFIDIDDSGSGTYVGLVESIDGHKKVLHFYDRGNPGACDIIHHLNDNKQSGTIEFWLRGTNTASWHNYFFEDSLGNNAFQIKVSLDHIYIRSGGAWHSVQAITDNVWYHIRIDFERTSNGYMSLSQNEFRIFIDDVEHGNYALENNNDVSQIHITTNTVQNIMDYYVDALAFSWDPYYEIGDNKYLASKDNITLTSELNNFTKSLIPSNSSFVMTNGTQVDNGTLGMLDDDYSTFNVSEVEGLYNATYSFTGETGETGTDIDFIDSETSYDGGSEVIAELDGHSEVLQHTDDATAGEDPDWSHNFDTNHNRGITEYWWRAENLANNPYPTIHWYEDATMCFRIRLTNANKIGTVNPPAGWDDFATFNNDQWYHIKVEWYSDNTFDIWLDNVLEVDGYSMESNQVTGINKIRYGTWGDTTESQWFDAWGENWDENYDIGGNNASTFAFGTYKGTYSFTTDIDNSDPAGWTVDETHGSIQIIADLGGHNKILDIHDTSNAGKPAAFYVDASTHNTDGDTIEWWMRTDDATFYSGIRFYDDGSHTTLGMRIRIESEQMDYEHSGGWTKAIDVVDNTWYHCKIVFDYTADTYDFYVDGVLIDSDIANSNDWTQFQEIILTGATGHLNYHHYYDAFGFSWDPNYDIGDNLLNNSVEVNFTTTINLGNDFNMHNYQLNYSSKTDIYQEVNMSVYNFNELRWDLINSSYNNQSFYESVFVFNSSHYNSTSDMLFRFEAVNSTSLFNIYLDLFNITLNWTSSVNIYTTLNKTLDFSFLNHYDTGFDDYQKLYNISIEFQYLFEEYLNFTSSMARFNNSYFADYSFFNELGLTEGDISFITGNDGDGDCEVSVIREQDNHDYVLDFNDNNNAGQGIWFSNFLDTSSGIVSFYIYFESVTEDTTVSLLDDSNYGPRLEWQDDGKLYYDDGSSDHEIESYSANQWYYIKINFTTATDTFDLWIDGDLKGEDLGFDDSSVDGIDQFYIMSDVAEEYHFYMDAIDYSWEDDWAECHYNFQFNSTDVDDFDLIFNITNGLIEIRDMNYTITFECLNLYGGNEIYQYFKIDPVFSIDYLQKTRGNWILNWSMNFTESSDYLIYNFTNSINSSLFLYRIGVECEDGWLIYNFTTNTSFSSDLTFNITDFLNNNSKTTFLDYYFEVYLAGNPSEVSFDDMVLWDFDSDFYNVNDCYIDDTLLGSHQNLTIYWNATDRYISNVEINQTLNSQTNVIFNETLINNTLQSVSFWNTTSGLYNLTLQFFDTHGNWELWAVNYTVIPSISLAAGYENPVFINTNNTVNFNVLSSAPIIEIYYDNSTDYIQEYNNDTYPLYQYEFNFTINYPVQTVYNVSIKVIDEYNDTYWMNITNLCHIQRTTIMDIINLKSSYDQDASLNLTISLRDLYNQPIQGKPINYTIYDHNNITFVNTSSTTDALGEIDIDILMNITWTEGFYHINCSFNDTAESYMGAWKLMSFEVLPIIQVVTNSSLVNLTVNGVNVSNNLLTINKTEANSFDLLIDHAGSLTFDLLIENASLYINKTVDYSDYVNYDFSFTQKSSPFTFITFNSANLTNIPDNFTYYYFDGTQSTNYNYDINSDSLEILSLIGSTYVNLDTFSVQLRYLDNLRTRTQITNTPRTDTASVLVSELFLAELDYKYWYFVGDLDINEVNQMEHLRTGTIYSGNDFTIENDKYKFDLSQKTEINDLFEAILDVNPNYNLTYEVLENNGTYSEVRVNYMSDIILENVTIVIPLRSDGVYMDNWSLSAIQSSQTYNLEIPNISFSTSVQSFTINGNSSIPTANISQYINEGAFTITESNYQTLSEYYNVYLEYERYSESWIVPTDEGWELDGVHYGTNYYGVGEGYFVCSGFDSSITSSYLRVKTNPISSIERVQGSGYVEYTIVCNYPAYDVNLEFYIQSEENIKLNAISTPSEFLTHIKLYDLDGVHYYQVIDFNLAQGTNVIRIEFEKLVIWDAAWLLIPAGAALLGFVIIYYGITKPESLKKLQFWKKKDKKRKRK